MGSEFLPHSASGLEVLAMDTLDDFLKSILPDSEIVSIMHYPEQAKINIAVKIPIHHLNVRFVMQEDKDEHSEKSE